MRSSLIKFVKGLIGFGISAYLLLLLVQSSGLHPGELLRSLDPRFVFLGLISLGIGFLFAAYRWYLQLRHIDVRLGAAVVVRLALIGQFFNLFIPGGVGGDLIKMVYLKKEAKERYPEAMLTVLLDRILGLSGLLVLALVAIVLNPGLFADAGPTMKKIIWVVAAAASGGLAALTGFLALPYLGGLKPLWLKFSASLPESAVSLLQRVFAALSLLRSRPLLVFWFLFLAMLGHLCTTFCVISVAIGIGGVDKLNFQDFLLCTQLANLVGAVPLTPGGVGGRDISMSFLLKECGAEALSSGAIPLVVTLILMIWSSLGGLALLWEKRSLAPEDDHEDQNSQGPST